ncbi:MAG: hypothetical protein IH884_01400 [Myxococcales bacterium]|nr:hypothetical protein [Myxococcales bacterium]
MTASEESTRAERKLDWLCWVFGVLAVFWAYLVHQGIGPAPVTTDPAWYQPSGFMTRATWLSFAFESTGRLIAILTFPALALTIAVFLTGRSAVARGLGYSAMIACVLFAYYGDAASRVWEFFYWRTSAVLACMALTLGFSLAAPFLAESWLRRSWPLRIALFLPVFCVVVGFIRNATGTDPRLQFSLSPWPAVPVFGMEVGTLFVMLWLMGAAIGTGGIALSHRRPDRKIPLVIGGVMLGVTTPLLIVAAGSSMSLLPFRAGAETYIPIAVACALAIALASSVGVRGRPRKLDARALHMAAGAALIAVPLVTGEVWARWDYYVTREHQARSINDALAAYLEKEEIYPDEMIELVEANYLDEVPTPSIGFGFLYDGQFRYRSFGSSYILEFPAPRWVECAYTPPYEDDDYADEEEDAEDSGGASDGDESFDASWSCPSKPPELW